MSSRSITYSYPNPNGFGPSFPPLNAEFSFALPLKVGDAGLEVQVIKYFLGLGDIDRTSPEFDAITATKLSDWQRSNRQLIYRKLGFFGDATASNSDVPNAVSQIESVKQIQFNCAHEPGFNLRESREEFIALARATGHGSESYTQNITSKEDLKDSCALLIRDLQGPNSQAVLPSNASPLQSLGAEDAFLVEQGSIGDATYDAMLDLGLVAAAQRLFASPSFQSMWTEDMTPAQMIEAFEPPMPEKPFPPIISADKKWVEYTYHTDLTRTMLGQASTDEQLNRYVREYFRKGVLKVFEYFGKQKTWEVYSEEGDDETKAYDKILKYQRRGEFEFGTTRKFTVSETSLNEQLNGESIDVLFGQSLAPGANAQFARLKKLNKPGLRPNSVLTLNLQVRNDLFELVEGGNSRGGTVDLTDPETYEKIAGAYETAKEAYAAIKGFSADDVNAMGDEAQEFIEKWGAAQKRFIEQQAKKAMQNAWEDALAGRGGVDEEFKRQLAANAAYQEAARRMSLKIGPTSKKYNVAKIRRKLKLVHKVMLEYDPDIEEFKSKNVVPSDKISQFKGDPSPIIPNLNVQSESAMFAKIGPALQNFLKVNGKTLDIQETGSSVKEEIEVFFAPIQKVLPPPKILDESANPKVDAVKKPSPSVKQVVGWRIHRVNYIKDGAVTRLTAGMPDFESEEPWLNPTTVGYFLNLEEMFKEASAPDSCTDLMSSAAIEFFARFTWPTLSFMYREKPPKGLLNINVDFNKEQIKKWFVEIKENQLLLSNNINNLMASTFLKQKGKLITANKVLPDFGKIPCDFKEMWKEFLNKWDMQAILCDFAKCIPNFKFDFSWKFKLPSIPRMPTFNPLHFVIPQIRIAIVDIIMSFICKLVKKLLDTLRAPDCTDILRFGMAYLSEAALLGEDGGPFERAPEKLTMFEKAEETIKNLNLPPDAMNGEDEASMDYFFDNISMVLTPDELCSLLEGNATEETCYVVLKVITSIENGLSKHINTVDLVRRFFEALGSVVDPFLCERIKELTELVVADELCTDNARPSTREVLESVGATPDEIAAELRDASRRRDAFRQLSESEGLGALLPTSYDPGTLEAANMPGPYSNPVHDQVTSLAIKTVLDNIKTHFNIDARAFADLLIDTSESLVQPGDPGFNPLEYCYFLYYTSQAERLSRGEPVYEMGEIIKDWYSSTRLATASYARVSSVLSSAEISRDLWQHIDMVGFPDDEKLIFDPNTPAGLSGAAKFGELVERHVITYMEKYRKIDAEVFPKFQALLRLDSSSIARKFPGPYNRREFNVRLLTHLLGRTTDSDIEILDATSVGDYAARFSVGMSDLSFLPGSMTDCYRVSYLNAAERYVGPRNEFEDAGMLQALDPATGRMLGRAYRDRYDAKGKKFVRVYNEHIPKKYERIRNLGIDVTSDVHARKLLRPHGFFQLLKRSFNTMSYGNPGATSWDIYEDNNNPGGVRNNIIPKIQGYIGDQAPSDLDGDDETSQAEVLFDAIYHSIEDEIDENNLLGPQRDSISPLYASVVDSINYRIHSSTRRSPFFDMHNIRLLKHIMSRQFILTRKNGEDCYVPNDKLLNFQEILEEFLNSYKKETNQPSRDPIQRDFSENGPLEESTIQSLVRLYIKVAVIEMLFKGIFLFSVVGCRRVFNSEFVVDYLTDNIIKTLDISLKGFSNKRKVYDVFRRMSGLEDKDSAVRSVVLANLEIKMIEDFVNKLFTTITSASNEHSIIEAQSPEGTASVEPRVPTSMGFYHSVKDKFYNEMLCNIKDSPRVDNYPRITVRSRDLNHNIVNENYIEDRIVNQMTATGAASRLAANLRVQMDFGEEQLRREWRQRGLQELAALLPNARREGVGSPISDFLESDGGYDTRPLGPYIPNLYSMFVFRGDTKKDIMKKMDDGHFWIERFYRIEDFEEFHKIYSEIQTDRSLDQQRGNGFLSGLKFLPPPPTVNLPNVPPTFLL